MQSFRRFITELFDSPVKYRHLQRSDPDYGSWFGDARDRDIQDMLESYELSFVYLFTIKQLSYVVTFYSDHQEFELYGYLKDFNIQVPTVRNCYMLVFKLLESSGNTDKHNNRLHVSSGYGVVGDTGVELPVLSTVSEIITAFLKEQRPAAVVFTADEPSRIKLYQRMLRVWKPMLKAQSYTGLVRRPGDRLSTARFCLKRTN